MAEIKIALAGNPNCGKTTLFNALTGSAQYVGNWPGVTVEKKEGRLQGRGGGNVIIQDLPGIYSLSPYTLEEVITRRYLVGERPDAILNLVDGTNLERNLYLTTQLLEIGPPVVVAVNMMDLVRKRGDAIDTAALSAALGCPVCEISALKEEGCVQAAEVAARAARQSGEETPRRAAPRVFTGCIARALAAIEEELRGKVDENLLRWYAVKLFERDAKVREELCGSGAASASPSASPCGASGGATPAAPAARIINQIDPRITACERELDDDCESLIAGARYDFIGNVVGRCVRKNPARNGASHPLTPSDKIDRIVTNRVLALPIFAVVMWLVYWLSMGPLGERLAACAEGALGGTALRGNLIIWLQALGVEPWLIDLVTDGIVGGVASVLSFVPQLLILFFLLSILEDIGYMARIAFITDRLFRRIGLSGKSFIPLLIGAGCGVPGVMATRTIENERDRRMTIMTVCFIPCGAKLPLAGLFAGALFGGSGLVAVSAYFIGVGAVVLSGVILKKTRLFAGEESPFVMELPAYHLPCRKNVLRATWERGRSFIVRAGTVILLCSAVLWFLQYFGVEGGRLCAVESQETSLLAGFGRAVAWVFVPLGFGDWQCAVAVLTGLIAKENIVATLGVLLRAGAGNNAAESAGLSALSAQLAQHFTGLSAYSFMIFNLLCAPCIAAMSAIRQEMNSSRWAAIAIGYMCGFAYLVSLGVYRLGRLFGGVLDGGAVLAVAAPALLIYLALRPARTARTAHSADHTPRRTADLS